MKTKKTVTNCEIKKTQLQMIDSHIQSQIGWLYNKKILVVYFHM